MAEPGHDPGRPQGTGRLRVHLGLGSNLGDRWAYLAGAVDALGRAGDGLAVSPVYETAPVGGPADQGPYLNCVARLWVSGSPEGVLGIARRLEAAAGRRRTVRFGPRTLDVDVLVLEAELEDGSLEAVRVDTEDLVVPHPRLGERAFVLAPLEDLSAELVDASWRERLGGEAVVAEAVRRVGEIVLGAR